VKLGKDCYYHDSSLVKGETLGVQVENVATRMPAGDGRKSSMNLADEVQSLLTRLTHDDEDFVQAVNVQLRRSPAVILYTQEQIDDIRCLCSKETSTELRSILSFDRTFNLSSLFLTVMVFRQRKVVRRATQEPPIFVGPMMLHGDGKYATYLNFFSTVNGALNGCGISASEFRLLDNVVTGSDDECALVNAAKTAFTNTSQLFCMIHTKDNVRHRLTSIGTSTSVREAILARLFGCSGVAEAASAAEQDDRMAELLQYVRQENVDAVDYLQQRVLTKIAANNAIKWREAWIGQRQWTNNNCESANHLLKIQVVQYTPIVEIFCFIHHHSATSGAYPRISVRGPVLSCPFPPVPSSSLFSSPLPLGAL